MKDIPGYEGLYAADENGHIVSLLNGKNRRAGELKPYVNTGGYLKVNLYKDGVCRHEYVHRLVALTYLPNPDRKRYVNHIDSNPTNNRPENLEWCSAKYNIGYSRLLGTQGKDKGVSALSVLTGERRVFPNMRSAATALFGKWYALNYKHKRCGSEFILGEWRITIDD